MKEKIKAALERLGLHNVDVFIDGNEVQMTATHTGDVPRVRRLPRAAPNRCRDAA
jgi:hypothetical protein